MRSHFHLGTSKHIECIQLLSNNNRSSLQTNANLISNNLQAIAAQLSEHQQLLQSTVVHPLPQFPVRTQEAILQTLLRTKAEPNIEEWVEQGRDFIKDQSNTSATKLSDNDRKELWQWAPNAANSEARKQKWGADYTLEEKLAGIETVVTGLKRELLPPPDDEGDDEDEEEDEDEYEDEEEEAEPDKMDVVDQPKPNTESNVAGGIGLSAPTTQMPLESIHKFMTVGKVG